MHWNPWISNNLYGEKITKNVTFGSFLIAAAKCDCLNWFPINYHTSYLLAIGLDQRSTNVCRGNNENTRVYGLGCGYVCVSIIPLEVCWLDGFTFVHKEDKFFLFFFIIIIILLYKIKKRNKIEFIFINMNRGGQ